jgi:hypothetical protein
MSFVVPMIAAAGGATGAALTTGSIVGTSTAAAAKAATIGSALAKVGSFASVAMPLVGAGMTAIGGIRQAQAYNAMGAAAAQSADYNAKLAETRGQQQASLVRSQGERQLSAIRSRIGKSGAAMAGTPLMVMAESAADVEIDALNQMWSANQQASMERAQGRATQREMSYRAGTSLLTTASRLF